MRAVAEGATLAGSVRVLAVALAAYLVLVQPVVGSWSHARFRRAVGDPRARLRRYRRTGALEWALVGVSLALVAAAPGLDLADVGVRWPRLSAYTVVGAVGLVLSVALLVGLRRRVDRGVEVIAPAEVSALLPRTATERRAFAGLAVTAGVCEEVLYRGFLLRYLTALLPGLGGTGAVLVAAVVFAMAHTYQGALSVVATALMALVFTALFVASHALWLPIIVHALVDLRALLLWRGDSRVSGTAAANGSTG